MEGHVGGAGDDVTLHDLPLPRLRPEVHIVQLDCGHRGQRCGHILCLQPRQPCTGAEVQGLRGPGFGVSVYAQGTHCSGRTGGLDKRTEYLNSTWASVASGCLTIGQLCMRQVW